MARLELNIDKCIIERERKEKGEEGEGERGEGERGEGERGEGEERGRKERGEEVCKEYTEIMCHSMQGVC